MGVRRFRRRPEFEAALRQNGPRLAAANVTIPSGAPARAVRITGSPEVPAFDPDREVIWTVEGSAARFDLAALLAKPAVALGMPLNSTNAVVQRVGGMRCMLARSTDTPSQFLFSSDQAGAYAVAITVSSIDLEPWARRSNAAKIPAAKLPAAQGLTQAQVDARVRALEPWGAGNPVPAGAPADDGKVLKRTAAGPAWGAMAYSELAGNPPGVTEQMDGLIRDFHIPNTNDSAPVRPAMTLFAAPAFDLDDYQYGEIHVSVTLTVAERSGGTLGFGDAANTTYRLTDIIFASTLRGSPAFTGGGSIEGQQIDNAVEVYNAGAKLGALRVYLGRDAQNRVGYLLEYRGGGTAGAELRVAAAIQLSFSPTDAPAPTSKGIRVGEILLTATAAVTFTNNVFVPRAWSGTASGYTPGENGKLWVPKTKELIGWMVKALVNNVVIDTATVPKTPGYRGSFSGSSVAITFKNGAESSLKVRFQSFSTRNVHRVNVLGAGNELPGNARLEMYEWV